MPRITDYYTGLKNPLADLNAVMMVAWQSVLDLHYYISDDGILYVVGKFEGEYYGWGPPLGQNLNRLHIDIFLRYLEEINQGTSTVLYLWRDYPLFNELFSSDNFRILYQASEYLYTSESLAQLPVGKMRSLKKQRDYFVRKFKPVTKEYSSSLSKDCLHILDNWLAQKKKAVPPEFIEKFEIEAKVCRCAIASELPLSGVVICVDDSPVAFSLGGNHSQNCFNCMFEKTDLSMNGLSVVVFSELGRVVKKNHELVNAGEDWGIPYLKEAKLKWQPSVIKDSFQLSRNK